MVGWGIGTGAPAVAGMIMTRTRWGISDPQVKSPGPRNTQWSTIPMIVVDAQYIPRPAGTKSTNHENMMGMNHCIIWFIC